MSNEIQVGFAGSSEVLRFQETVRLGRAATNGIVVNDDYVSGEHLELRRTAAGWEIVDLESRNGTFINGERVIWQTLGHLTRVRLGHPAGVEMLLRVPALEHAPGTRVVSPDEIAGRYTGEEDPENMSERTRLVRATLQQHRQQIVQTWSKRTRQLRIAVGILILLSLGAAGTAVWQSQRVRAQREAAASLFHTLKALELDVRRLQAAAGPDAGLQERQARLEAQYEELLTTLGIYSDDTPEEIRLIYRTVHRLGESEANVPREFVDEVLKYIALWKSADLQAGIARATAGDLGPMVAGILLEHNLPREFFYLALQESKLDANAIGPSTRLGIPKGMWQFIPPTAEAYGLRLGPLQGERQVDPMDERHNVAKATAAAARYLEDIYTTDAQASGLLVMAAYNMGETRVISLLRSLPESPSERNFWALLEKHRDRIPEETYNYVYRIVSAAVIGANPQLFGFDFAPPFGPPPSTDQDPANR